MTKLISLFSVFVLGSVAVAHATPITGGLQTFGLDSFTIPAGLTPGTITFLNNPPAPVAGNGTPDGQAQPAITGTFATYLTPGVSPITYLPQLPDQTPVNYSLGQNSVLVNTGFQTLQLFSVTGGGETFFYNLTDYNAGIVNGTGQNGCASGYTCLDFSGNGFYTASGVNNTLTPTPGAITFTTQYASGAAPNSTTTFSASSATNAVPEPSSLVLLGTGLVGLAGLARRKFKV